MSRLEELINEYCPDGVEYKPIKDVSSFISGFAFKSSLFCDEGKPICKTTNIRNGEVDFEGMVCFDPKDYEVDLLKYLVRPNDIVVGMSGTIKVGINSKKNICYLNQRVGKFEPYTDIILNKFLYYVLCNCVSSWGEAINGGSVKNLSNRDVLSYKVPVPPLEVQCEIVRILDKYSAVVAEIKDRLADELTARKKQYEHYRDDLLSFEGSNSITDMLEKMCPDGIEYKTLGEIANDIYRGAGIKRTEVTEEGIPCVRYGEIYTSYDIWFDECISHTNETKQSNGKYFEYGDILFAITGESVEEIAKSIAYVGHEKCMAGGDIVVLKHDQDPKYMAYALSTIDAQKQKSKGKIKSKVVHSSVPALKTISVPVPPLEVQHEIVRILDSFSSLCSDMGEGIPAEIEARQKQYEYYRDKLLTFKRKES